MATVMEQLKVILGSTYSLASQTQLAHWNVTGPNFASLHKLFNDQYDDLYEASDDIAEYIRSKGEFSPGGLLPLAKLSSIKPLDIKGLKEKEYLNHLIEGHQVMIKLTKDCGDSAGASNDTDTQNFMNERSTDHKKMLWMLESSL